MLFLCMAKFMWANVPKHITPLPIRVLRLNTHFILVAKIDMRLRIIMMRVQVHELKGFIVL